MVEGFVTLGALVRSVIGVGQEVCTKVCGYAENFGTVGTRKLPVFRSWCVRVVGRGTHFVRLLRLGGRSSPHQRTRSACRQRPRARTNILITFLVSLNERGIYFGYSELYTSS